jgi:hypothetical protein
MPSGLVPVARLAVVAQPLSVTYIAAAVRGELGMVG